MKQFILLALFIIMFTPTLEAHPGRTASDGCHYCRTRCDYWGVPWGARHCHGGAGGLQEILMGCDDLEDMKNDDQGKHSNFSEKSTLEYIVVNEFKL